MSRAGEGAVGDDLIERLREFTTDPTGTPALVDAVPRGIFARAADEIERLTAKVDILHLALRMACNEDHPDHLQALLVRAEREIRGEGCSECGGDPSYAVSIGGGAAGPCQTCLGEGEAPFCAGRSTAAHERTAMLRVKAGWVCDICGETECDRGEVRASEPCSFLERIADDRCANCGWEAETHRPEAPRKKPDE